jgi:hypothetical protein
MYIDYQCKQLGHLCVCGPCGRIFKEVLCKRLRLPLG